MYLSHFGLSQPPFAITPNPHFFYSGNKRGAILDALIYAVMHGEGIIKVTGEVGSGKTMLCRILDDMLPANVEVIYLVNPTLSREEVVYTIAGELGLPTEGLRADEMIRQLQSALIAKHIDGKQVVLLVEEAQAMPLDTLEEIRLFSNLETAHHKLLQIVLFGQPELDENLSVPRMRQLKERITHSFKVPPLESAVLSEFLMFRMRAAGYHGPDLFTNGALKMMAKVSEGIIRRISILADKSLLAAFADNTHAIQRKHVKAAVEDSEFFHAGRRRLWRRLLTATAIALLSISAAAGTWFVLQSQGQPTPPLGASKKISAAPTAPVVATSNSETDAIQPAADITSGTKIETEVETEVETQAEPSMPSTETSTQTLSSTQSTTPFANHAEPPAKPQSAAPLPSPLRTMLKQSEAWLATQDPQTYTLQLALITLEPAQINHYLENVQPHIKRQEIHFYPTRIRERAQLGVLYGSFNRRSDAVLMQKELAASYKMQAQLRTVSGLNNEIVRTNSKQLWLSEQI